MEKINSKLIILGSGPAGCTAAVYCARSDLSPIMIHGNQPGGQLTITTDVENYPGFENAVQGPWLMEQMIVELGCGFAHSEQQLERRFQNSLCYQQKRLNYHYYTLYQEVELILKMIYHFLL